MLSNLKDLRKEFGLSQKVVAEKLNISQQTYSDYENDKTEPTMEVLIQIAKLFGVTVDELLGISESRVTPIVNPISDSYTAEERQLIEKYRTLNSHCKKLINNTINTLVTTSAAATEQKKRNS